MAWAIAIPAIMQGAATIAGAAAQGNETEAAKRAREGAYDTLMHLDEFRPPTQDYSYINYAGDYSPYALGSPIAAQHQTISEDPATRAIQMEALKQLVSQANGAYDMQNQAEQFQALSAAAQQANARQGAIRQAMERKGQGGTGLNALMQSQAAQDAANRAQSGTLDAVSKAALQKLAAMQSAVGAAGQVRGQDFNTLRYNTDTINDFNRLNTGLANQWHAQDVANQNAAQLRNVGTRQDIAGRNAGIENANVDRQYNSAKDVYQSKYNRGVAAANALNGVATGNMQAGQVYNNIGQQMGGMFNNVGAGAAAAMNAYNQNNQPQFTSTPSRKPNGADEENLNGDTFKSWYE